MSAVTAKIVNFTPSPTHVNPFLFELERKGKFAISPRDEDGHTAIERHLVAALDESSGSRCRPRNAGRPHGGDLHRREAYKLVKAGMPFRDTYRKVAEKFAKSS